MVTRGREFSNRAGGKVKDIISKHASNGGFLDAYALQLVSEVSPPQNDLVFLLTDGSGSNTPGYVRLLSSTPLAINTWHHVVGSWDGTTMRIYINGILDASTPFSGPIKDSPLNVGIGRNGGDGWFEYFDGIIDEAAIYNRALTLEEIQEHFQNGQLGLGYCEDSPPVVTLACRGFEPPMDKGPVSVKNNRALPLKARSAGSGLYSIPYGFL